MEIKEYFQTIWKWWWLIVVCTLCAGITSFVISSNLPPVYEARVVIMWNQTENTGIVDYSSLLGGQQMIETYQELLKTRPVLETTITNLGLSDSPRELVKRIETSVIPETQLLVLKVEDNDAQRAADIASEIVLTFLHQRSAEQQFQELESHEETIVEQMRALKQAIEQTEAEIEQSRVSTSLLTQERLANMQDQQSRQRATYASLLTTYLNIHSVKSRLLDMDVVEWAYPPSEPIRPRKVFNTGVALIGGGVIACMIAFLLDYLDNTFEDAASMRETLSLPSLGTIPLVRSWQKNGYAYLKGEDWLTGEAFRILRTNIQFANVDSTIRTLLVTSPGPSEGKTSIVASLGRVLAQNDRKVLLVDADLRNPHLHRHFDIPNRTGLTSLLMNRPEQHETMVETDIPNLYVLPSGPTPPNPSELLGSQRMAQLVAEFQSLADVVLFDIPPVLACADAMVLASQTDGVVFVIDSQSTRQEEAVRAVEMLRNVNARILGGVLNKVSTRSSGYSYYYHKQPDVLTRWQRLMNSAKAKIRGSA